MLNISVTVIMIIGVLKLSFFLHEHWLGIYIEPLAISKWAVSKHSSSSLPALYLLNNMQFYCLEFCPYECTATHIQYFVIQVTWISWCNHFQLELFTYVHNGEWGYLFPVHSIFKSSSLKSSSYLKMIGREKWQKKSATLFGVSKLNVLRLAAFWVILLSLNEKNRY